MSAFYVSPSSMYRAALFCRLGPLLRANGPAAFSIRLLSCRLQHDDAEARRNFHADAIEEFEQHAIVAAAAPWPRRAEIARYYAAEPAHLLHRHRHNYAKRSSQPLLYATSFDEYHAIDAILICFYE